MVEVISDVLDNTTMRAFAKVRIQELREQLSYTDEGRDKLLEEIKAWQAYLDSPLM